MNAVQHIGVTKPLKLSISSIVKLVEKHCAITGNARLPLLAMYAMYQYYTINLTRYEGKTLCPLATKNSANMQTGRIGDIDVHNADGSAFEGVKIISTTQVSPKLVADTYEKFFMHRTNRYYILSTVNMHPADWDAINKESERIKEIHGCEVIVDNVFSTLKYYLRLMNDPAEFIDRYVELLKKDETVKFQHKTAWNDLVSQGL